MPARYADHLEHSHAFFDWYDDGVFSALVQLVKPLPEIILEAARWYLSVALAELVFVDDVEHSIEAALALGWQTLHFRGAAACEAELLPAALGGPGAARSRAALHLASMARSQRLRLALDQAAAGPPTGASANLKSQF